MIKLIWGKTFIRAAKKWRKKHPELDERFKERLSLFSEEPFHPSLKTHGLSGNLEGSFAFSINHEYRLVFKFLADDEVLLINIGSHDEVY
ncbi:MAG: type II toxin-antitoxin system mRNA interferase toxin, RelE/StbE family [Methylococcaceae bacterium]|nr:type II toxin-antitoxin system mRNA interferase toxin, RelE/StbE family [Methylococcaceae bacterium]